MSGSPYKPPPLVEVLTFLVDPDRPGQHRLRRRSARPPGIDYLTGDHATRVEDLAPDAIWYDSQGKPFDLMTTVFVHDKGRMLPKPRPQIEQGMGIILVHGGRYFAWNNPTRQSGLLLERQEMLGKAVAPFLWARQAWCLDSQAMPDVALFHGATAHYAVNTVTPNALPRQNPALLAACEGLCRLHLSPEMISDHRLEIGAIRGRLLILEDSPRLSVANQRALRRFVQEGGRVLLTGRAIDAAGLVQMGGHAGLVQETLRRGDMCCLAQPLFSNAGNARADLLPDPGAILRQVLPITDRLIVADAPDTVEVVLREKADTKIVHLVNIAEGSRAHDPHTPAFINLRIEELPPAPACRITVRLPARPAKVMLQPQGTECDDWTWNNGLLQVHVPGLEIHQMVVIQ